MLTKLKDSIELGKQLVQVFNEIKYLFIANKSDAREDLAEVFVEFSKFFDATNSVMYQFLSMSFQDNESLGSQRELLLRFKTGDLVRNINEARGHCSKIKQIYEEHLNPWFYKVLGTSNEKLDALNNLFEKMTEYDNNMFSATDEINNKLREYSELILGLLRQTKLQEANDKIWEIEQELSPYIKETNLLLAELINLKNEFTNK